MVTIQLNPVTSSSSIPTVNVLGGSSLPAKTLIIQSGLATGVQTTTLATVTAGKTAHILGFVLTANTGNAAAVTNGYLKDGSGNVICRVIVGGATTNTQAVTACMKFDYNQEPTVAASTTIQVQSDNANGNVTCTVYYYEV